MDMYSRKWVNVIKKRKWFAEVMALLKFRCDVCLLQVRLNLVISLIQQSSMGDG